MTPHAMNRELTDIADRFPPGATIVVAMSGGVDSAAAAALLRAGGYDVIGITLQIWDPNAGRDRHGGCCSLGAVEDARRAASRIGIPHYVLNFQEYFGRHVVDRFVQEYARGRTPNPCVDCNRTVKFAELLRQAKGLGAVALATGHYARVRLNRDTGRHELRRSLCDAKDQTYALYSLTQEQLAATVFPLGGIRDKAETRRIASEAGLALAAKPDSQDICFVPEGGYAEYLRERAPDVMKPGPIVDTDGAVVGQHDGVAGYTIGQRRRLPASSNGPLYVVSLDAETRTVVVGRDEQLYSREFRVADTNWISVPRAPDTLAVSARIRYNACAASAVIRGADDGSSDVFCEFAEPQRAVTPGQAAVFYSADVVVGGGCIV